MTYKGEKIRPKEVLLKRPIKFDFVENLKEPKFEKCEFLPLILFNRRGALLYKPYNKEF